MQRHARARVHCRRTPAVVSTRSRYTTSLLSSIVNLHVSPIASTRRARIALRSRRCGERICTAAPVRKSVGRRLALVERLSLHQSAAHQQSQDAMHGGLGNALTRVSSSSVSDSSDVAICSSTANARSVDEAAESSPGLPLEIPLDGTSCFIIAAFPWAVQ